MVRVFHPFLPVPLQVFLICLMYRSHSVNFWFSSRDNFSMFSYTFKTSVEGGKFRGLLCHHLDHPPLGKVLKSTICKKTNHQVFRSKAMSLVNRNNFTSSFPNQKAFLIFLMTVASTSSSMLNKSDGSGHSCLALDLRVKAFRLSLFEYVNCRLFLYGFYYVVVVPFYSKCVECFCFCFHERVFNYFSNTFSTTQLVFLFYSVYVVYYIDFACGTILASQE